MKLLLVEDDLMLGESICAKARQSCWHIDLVGDATAARLALLENTYAVILLDFDLPKGSALAILRWIRDRFDATPVMMLTARGQLSRLIAGLDAGADGYVVKPIHFNEMSVRVRSVVRHSFGRFAAEFTYGDVIIDRSRRVVTKNGVNLRLSLQEFRALIALVERQGHVVGREHLHRLVYGTAKRIKSNNVAALIQQLKLKLECDFIQTVHGIGYAIVLPKK